MNHRLYLLLSVARVGEVCRSKLTSRMNICMLSHTPHAYWCPCQRVTCRDTSVKSSITCCAVCSLLLSCLSASVPACAACVGATHPPICTHRALSPSGSSSVSGNLSPTVATTDSLINLALYFRVRRKKDLDVMTLTSTQRFTSTIHSFSPCTHFKTYLCLLKLR